MRKIDLLYYNNYGGFTKDGKEYIIKTSEKQTPMPWSHIIANNTFGTIVTANGGGYTWSNNSRENKITTWSNDPILDPPSEKITIETKNKKINVLPYETLEGYEIIFGFGYAAFNQKDEEITTETMIYVPINENKKIIRMLITNNKDEEKEVKVKYKVSPVLGVARDYTKKHIVIQKEKNIIKISNKFRDNYQNEEVYITASEKINLNKEDKNVITEMEVTLSPHENKVIFIELGIYSSYTNCETEEKYINNMSNIKEFWNEKTSKVRVKTPVESMNIMLNGWLLYQTLVSRIWGRTSFYQAGGAYGFRDQLQDSLIMLYYEPEFVRKQIIYHAKHQFKQGDVLHWWHPEKDNGIRTKYTDDLLWLPFLISEYIKKEKDYSILDEETTYVKCAELSETESERYGEVEIDEKKESIYKHAIRAIDRSLNFAENGLPQMGTGDWNDGMNGINGQSVWLGFFMYDVINRFIKICEYKNDTEKVEKYNQILPKLKKALNTAGWDGKWYKRAYFKNNKPLGSNENDECKIDGISQNWAVISGAGEEEKCKTALECVENYLVDKENLIIKLLTPAFSKTELEPGYIKSYIPGVRENGGQYTHGAIWGIIANAMMKNGERATEYFRIINPIEHARTKEAVLKYKVEPYVVSADVYSNPNMLGRGGWTWYTGSSSWLFIAGFEYVLGIKKENGKLKINPCIPKDWESFIVHYKNKNARYEINVYNPEHKSTGIKTIYLDNDEKKAAEILLEENGEHRIDIIM